MSRSNRALICRRHLVESEIKFHRSSALVADRLREQKSSWRECTLRHHYIKNASSVPWTDRVNHERSLEFRAWFSWDRSRERENLGERCQRFVLQRVPLVDTFTLLFFSSFSCSISSLTSVPFSFILILPSSSVTPPRAFTTGIRKWANILR